MGSNMQAFYDGMALVGSLVIMVLVIVATYYASRWYAGRMKGRPSGRHINIIERVSVGSGCALLIVQAGGRVYLLGAGDKHVDLICELEDFDLTALQEQDTQVPFGRMLQAFLNKAGNPKDNGNEK